jgi:signal transduction histidine kinase
MISKLVEENARHIKGTENGQSIKMTHSYRKKSIIVEVDRERLNQVISNLLVNAIKFTEEGKISISAQENIESIRNNNIKEVIVTVKDTGSGIDPEIALNLFSKFTTLSEQGTGLGLFISKNIIEGTW